MHRPDQVKPSQAKSKRADPVPCEPPIINESNPSKTPISACDDGSTLSQRFSIYSAGWSSTLLTLQEGSKDSTSQADGEPNRRGIGGSEATLGRSAGGRRARGRGRAPRPGPRAHRPGRRSGRHSARLLGRHSGLTAGVTGHGCDKSRRSTGRSRARSGSSRGAGHAGRDGGNSRGGAQASRDGGGTFLGRLRSGLRGDLGWLTSHDTERVGLRQELSSWVLLV